MKRKDEAALSMEGVAFFYPCPDHKDQELLYASHAMARKWLMVNG